MQARQTGDATQSDLHRVQNAQEELHSMLYSIVQSCCSHSVDKALSMIQDIADTGYEDIQHLQSHCELLKSLGSKFSH
jgi:hypothetical protein